MLLGLGPEEFARLAAKALTPRVAELVAVDHVHGGTVSVREQTALLHERLRRSGGASFRSLTADCQGTLEVVARFLGLLELYREGLVAFEQAEALSELRVRWTGPAPGEDRRDGGSDGTRASTVQRRPRRPPARSGMIRPAHRADRRRTRCAEAAGSCAKKERRERPGERPRSTIRRGR